MSRTGMKPYLLRDWTSIAASVIFEIAYPTARPIGCGKASVAKLAMLMALSHGFAALDF